jgi:hypothetical protein
MRLTARSIRSGSELVLDRKQRSLNEHGEAYTAGEHREWLEAAGFEDIQYGPAPAGFGTSGIGLVTARKRA